MTGAPPTQSTIDADYRRQQNAGGIWIVGSVLVMVVAFALSSRAAFAVAVPVCIVLFAAGMIVRRRAWKAMRSRVGDEQMSKAHWRARDREHDEPVRRTVVGFVAMLAVAIYLYVRKAACVGSPVRRRGRRRPKRSAARGPGRGR